MKRNLFLFLTVVGLAFGILSCSGSGTSSGGDDEAGVASTGAAVAALFGSGDEARLNKGTMQRLAKLLVNEAIAQEDGGDTCSDVDGPDNISIGFPGDAGTYGDPNGNTIVVTEDNFCQDADGTENEGDDLFATYQLLSTVTGTCDSGTIEMTAGTGIWRNTDDCFPQIYGTFTINGSEVDCYICLGEGGNTDDESSCSNSSDGIAVTLVDDTCTIQGD